MTTTATGEMPAREKPQAKAGEPEEAKKLPGVPSHLQAAVQQLIGDDKNKPAKPRGRASH